MVNNYVVFVLFAFFLSPEPEINLECEFDNTITVTEGNLLPPTYCNGTYVTLKRM